MMPDLHVALQRLVYEKGRILPQDVDVRFDVPRREWVTSLTRPTLDFFLFDVRENTDLRSTSPVTTRGNGSATFRLPPRRFDLRYLVSALTTEVEDEHRLLWRALVTLLRHAELPEELLPDSIRGGEFPLIAQVMKPEQPDTLLDVWGGLELTPRPSLLYVVTVPVNLDISFEAPLVFTRTTRYVRSGDGEISSTGTHIGGVVRDRSGRPVERALVAVDGRGREAYTDADGRFVLGSVGDGPLTLVVTGAGKRPTRVDFSLPNDSYDIVLD